MPSGRFVLVDSSPDCVYDSDNSFSNAEITLPGRCSDFKWYWGEDNTGDDGLLLVDNDYNALCPGEIAGIVLGVVAFTGITGGLLASGGKCSGGFGLRFPGSGRSNTIDTGEYYSLAS